MTVQPKKPLGQHFLTDPRICRKIVRFAAIRPGDAVIEIGPGTGLLTQSLLAAAERVTALEIDSHLVRLLRAKAGNDPAFAGLAVVEADVLKAGWPKILDSAVSHSQSGRNAVAQDGRIMIVGNLPYNIGTRIVKRMIPWKNRFHSFTFMLQKEVADRICAPTGSKDYGSLSVGIAQHFARVSGFTVAAGSFRPPPKVTSAVMKLIPDLQARPPAEEACFEKLVRRSFQHRRKTLANNLKGFDGVRDWSARLSECGIAPHSRPQQITLDQYRCLCQML
ncbi:MAG: 16S rRNA (adenine(1518)-N(6)/adenine(1519)-N(6))-dimethyltransferase RsmA [Acidobacteriota bacterium]